MLIVLEPLGAETLARLRAPLGLPAGSAFQPVSMEAALSSSDAFSLTASLQMTESAETEALARWLWDQVEEAAPLVVRAGGVKARVGEPAALAWLIDRARGRG